MKRNILMFFFCTALLSAFSQAHAGSGPLRTEEGPGLLQASLPPSGIDSIIQGNACPPSADDTLPDYAVDGPAPECVEEEGPQESAYIYYEDPLRADTVDICLEDGPRPDLSYNSLFDEPGLMAGAANGNICLSAGAEPTVEDSIPGVPIVVNKNVESFIKYFQGNGRKHFEKWLDRSQHYMVTIREILRENDLPEDLSYIAFIESGLNPKAISRANAVGMWQFMQGTGVGYGLRVDWWMDERMDPEKSTRAAARYFTDLYGRFGSWYLAAAGYNAGEGRVMRAMKKHGSDDFWEIASHKKTFKRETRDYVPKYLAALMIAKDPESYGFEKIEYREGPLHEKVKVSQATDLRVIARAASTTVEEIQRLNPELRRWFTPPDYPDYEVKIPVGKTLQFIENMSKIPPAMKIAFLRHKIKSGDTLSHIARRYKTSVQPIMDLNNLQNTRRLRPGMVIVIPVRAENPVRKGRKVADATPLNELDG